MLNSAGHLHTYECLILYEFPVSPKDYAIVFDAIPTGAKMLLSAPEGKDCVAPSLDTVNIYIDTECRLVSVKATNKRITHTHSTFS